VTLLLGRQATWRGECRAHLVQAFTTTANLRESLRDLAELPFDAVFHAAAVSDFTFGRVWRRAPSGELSEIQAGKIASRLGVLLAELVPTSKILAELRGWFAKARLVGWKYEVDGNRPGVIELAEKQMAECLTDACVANGPAYGAGFGLVRRLGAPVHLADDLALFKALEQMIDGPAPPPAPSSRG
jgi:phosphopantothenoylcysteine decarboxylase/phosphopantothenate--cysteine ligase